VLLAAALVLPALVDLEEVLVVCLGCEEIERLGLLASRRRLLARRFLRPPTVAVYEHDHDTLLDGIVEKLGQVALD